MKPLRLVVLCPHFEPDMAPTGVVMTRIVHNSPRADINCMLLLRCLGTASMQLMLVGAASCGERNRQRGVQ